MKLQRLAYSVYRFTDPNAIDNCTEFVPCAIGGSKFSALQKTSEFPRSALWVAKRSKVFFIVDAPQGMILTIPLVDILAGDDRVSVLGIISAHHLVSSIWFLDGGPGGYRSPTPKAFSTRRLAYDIK